MSDAGNSAKTHPKGETFIHKWRLRFVAYVKRQRHQSGTQNEPESRQDQVARRMTTATVWIAFFTAILAVVSIYQWRELDSSGRQTDQLLRLYRQQLCLYQQQLAQLTKQAGDIHDLAVAAGKQADASGTIADDNGRMLRGTQAAVMNFTVYTQIPYHTVQFFAGNSGNAEARDFHAHEVVTVRKWPDKSILLGPFNRQLGQKRVGGKTGGVLGPSFHDDYVIPKTTPEIAEDLSNGKAYITVQWRANYEDGFGTRVYSSTKEFCQTWIEVGRVNCQTGPNSSIDNSYVGQGPCANIDTLRQIQVQNKSDAQKTCKQPN